MGDHNGLCVCVACAAVRIFRDAEPHLRKSLARELHLVRGQIPDDEREAAIVLPMIVASAVQLVLGTPMVLDPELLSAVHGAAREVVQRLRSGEAPAPPPGKPNLRIVH